MKWFVWLVVLCPSLLTGASTRRASEGQRMGNVGRAPHIWKDVRITMPSCEEALCDILKKGKNKCEERG